MALCIVLLLSVVDDYEDIYCIQWAIGDEVSPPGELTILIQVITGVQYLSESLPVEMRHLNRCSIASHTMPILTSGKKLESIFRLSWV